MSDDDNRPTTWKDVKDFLLFWVYLIGLFLFFWLVIIQPFLKYTSHQ